MGHDPPGRRRFRGCASRSCRDCRRSASATVPTIRSSCCLTASGGSSNLRSPSARDRRCCSSTSPARVCRRASASASSPWCERIAARHHPSHDRARHGRRARARRPRHRAEPRQGDGGRDARARSKPTPTFAMCISAMSETLLTVTDIHTYYGDSYVLQGLSLSLPKGRIAAILGRNGMGKTTLIRSVAGLTPPRSGDIVFRGRSLVGLPPYAIAQQGIAIVPQGRRIFKSLSVRENLLLPTSVLARSSSRADDAQAAQALGLRRGAEGVSAARRAHRQSRQRAERRRAADAGDRPSADGQPGADPDGRALGRPVAAAGAAGAGDHAAAARRWARRSCSSSRTCSSPCRQQTMSTCSPPVASCSRAPPQRSPTRRRCSTSTSVYPV